MRNIKFENQTGTLLSKRGCGLLMFIGVPFCIWLYYDGKVATVVFVGVQLIFLSVYEHRSNK